MTDDKHITLQVEGMDCSNCALAITKTLKKEGMQDVFVDFATGEATFILKDKSKLSSVKESIKAIGYKVVDNQNEEVKKFSFFSSIENKFYFCLLFTIPLLLHMLPITLLQDATLQLILCVPVFVVGFIHFGRSAFNSIKVGMLHMDVLIVIGATAAFAYSLMGTIEFYGTHQVHNYLFYETSASIITLVLLGNLLEHRSVKQTTSAIRELSAMQVIKAKRITFNNGSEQLEEVDFSLLKVGDVLMVNNGDKIPVDGEVIDGVASVDESMISGESLPVEKSKKSKVIGGTIVVNGSLRMLAETVGDETVLSKIIQLVKNAQKNKPEIQKLGDRISAVFVPVVLGISLLTFLVSYFGLHVSSRDALMRSIAVLVISCPCAMGLATPTAVMVGIGRAAKNGILIKGGNTLELFASIRTIIFDKTGTLTTGDFKIKQIDCINGENEMFVKNILYTFEQHSSHPIANSIVTQLKGKATLISGFSEIIEEKGIGVKGKSANGDWYTVGSYAVASKLVVSDAHNVYVVKNNELIATVDLEDELKHDVKEMLADLASQNIKTVMLSGDTKNKCEAVATTIGIDIVYSQQSPSQKITVVDEFVKKSPTVMIGDGINDAPALAKATVGVSISNATQVAIQSAQIILLKGNELSNIALALRISKHTLITIKQNLFWAFFYNIVAIPFAAAGFLSPIIGTIAMALSDVIVIGNSIRLKTKKLS